MGPLKVHRAVAAGAGARTAAARLAASLFSAIVAAGFANRASFAWTARCTAFATLSQSRRPSSSRMVNQAPGGGSGTSFFLNTCRTV